ncbi:MAG: molybdopterin-dependent oxidoreductase [Rhodospirillaceae bacterium]|nr:molybdopterin-dependent oxidoreductase [Rhodospirillaceae bacterium]
MTETVHPSQCWECNTYCGSLITMRDGKVAKIGPNPDHPGSKGAFCVKGIRAVREWTDNENRLLHPMRRVGPRGSGQWERISWDNALEEMAERLAAVRSEYGPLSIAGAVSGGAFSRGAVMALLMRSIGSPNWMINQDLCGGCQALGEKLTGTPMKNGEDIDNARCALLVGRNPYAADPTQWLALKALKKRGGRIVVIDPVQGPASDLADIWLRPRPGTDAALALSIAHILVAEGKHDKEFVDRWCHGFEPYKARIDAYPPAVAAELTGVPAEDIVAAAEAYAEGPSVFVPGHGIDAFSAGVQTFRAFDCLVAISGNLDRRGGNRLTKKPKGFRTYLDVIHDPQFRLPREIETQTIGAEQFPLWAGPEGWQTACHNPSVIEAVLTDKPYPVRAMYISGVNIVVTYPDAARTIEALKSLDFIAVATQNLNPTSAYADIVLPKTTTSEEEEVQLIWGGPCIGYTNPVVAPRGEARCDLDIALALRDRLVARQALTQDFLPWADQRAFNEFLLGDSGITIDALREQGYATFPYELGAFEQNGFATSTGKVELYSERLDALGLDPLPNYTPPTADTSDAEVRAAYPLVLLTGLREKTYHHSRFRDQAWARKVSPDPLIQIHPDTAAEHGICDSQWITVHTADTDTTCRARAQVTEGAPPGVVATGMGWWDPLSDDPEFGARDININGAMSYGGPWDPVTGSSDSRGRRCRITPLALETDAAD